MLGPKKEGGFEKSRVLQCLFYMGIVNKEAKADLWLVASGLLQRSPKLIATYFHMYISISGLVIPLYYRASDCSIFHL